MARRHISHRRFADRDSAISALNAALSAIQSAQPFLDRAVDYLYELATAEGQDNDFTMRAEDLADGASRLEYALANELDSYSSPSWPGN